MLLFLWCSKHFCLCARRRFCYTKKDAAAGSSGQHHPSHPSQKHLSLSLPAWQSLFREHNNALFEGSSSLSTFFLSAFLKTTRAREGRVLLFLWFFGRRRSKKRVFLFTRTTRVFRSPSEGAERRRTRARRVQSLSRNEKDAYFLSLFFFLECATENAADGVNKNKTTREDGSTTDNRRAGKERR